MNIVGFLKENDTPIRWTQDGHSMFVAESRSGARIKILRVNLDTGERAVWKEIVARSGDQRVSDPVITPDGKSYAYTHYRGSSDLYMVEGLK